MRHLDTGQQHGLGYMTLVSGTAMDGVWEHVMTIPTGAAPGTWDFTVSSVHDILGNRGYLVTTIGTVAISGPAPDVAGPVIVSHTLTPSSHDLANGPAVITARVRITDSTGSKAPLVYMRHLDTGQQHGLGYMTLVSGTAMDGVWEHVMTIPTGAAPGTWDFTVSSVHDILGNRGYLVTTIGTVAISGPAPDVAGPVIVSHTLTPSSHDLANGPAVITARVRITDSTGSKAPLVYMRHLHTGQQHGLGYMTLVSGTAMDGVWEHVMTIPTGAAPGTWDFTVSSVHDILGNRGYLVTTIGTVGINVVSATAPTITGTIKIGSVLTAVPGAWGPAPVALAYQWKSNGVAITGATATTYTPQAADFGKTITVTVTGTKTGYTTTAKTSARTATVTVGSLTAPVPTITGTIKIGSVLTAVPGAWGPAPVALAYQWKSNGVAITGATATTYTPQAADFGKTITVTVTGTKTGYTTTAKTSARTATVTVGSLTAPVPTITGTIKIGSVLTAVPGAWGPAPVALAYQWKSNGVAITGATATTYTPQAADFGKTITVTVTGTKTGYTTTAKTSARTATVTVGSLTAPVPTITGTIKIGSVLTAVPGAWGPAPVALAYQWKSNGVAITGATATTYTPQAADFGKTITVTVTGTKTGYTTTAKTSARTATVTAGSLTAPVPTITGTIKIGSVLTAVPGAWGPAPVALAYQWKSNGVAITGATATTYTPQAADFGKTITVTVTGTKTGYTTTAKTSARTATVTAGA